ncbi:glycosyltransferase family A protein [Lignipirellula cremea]|uniref:Glycosyl transferase family 2 n=1 Tax=Lignipirellula cremea TaxID=2528010 RepID=A0A518DL25_9BACT|nr:glycosyltransferase family A protein [Lignipirellula cremea]QDU92539.1 Glycosyl transferase family 2 [Lignipirellula cremea]
MQPAAARIPCVVIVFFDEDTVRQALDALVRLSHRLEIHVVENWSPQTATAIRPYVESLLREGKIHAYYLFEENISNNALLTVLEHGHVPLDRDYILITDGDLVPDSDDWLEEELAVLQAHPEVFACGIRLDLANMPLKTFPDMQFSWSPVDRGDYLEALTGGHHLLLRGPDFQAFMNYRRRKNLRFVDSVMHQYAARQRRRWAATRDSSAVHLTWDMYADLEHPYTKLKVATYQNGACWDHSMVCPYERATAAGIEQHAAAVGLFRQGWLDTLKQSLGFSGTSGSK